jgi:hypothetical protein
VIDAPGQHHPDESAHTHPVRPLRNTLQR